MKRTLATQSLESYQLIRRDRSVVCDGLVEGGADEGGSSPLFVWST